MKPTKTIVNNFRKFVNEHNFDTYNQLVYDNINKKYFFNCDYTKNMRGDNTTVIIEVCKKDNDYKKFTLNELLEIIYN